MMSYVADYMIVDITSYHPLQGLHTSSMIPSLSWRKYLSWQAAASTSKVDTWRRRRTSGYLRNMRGRVSEWGWFRWGTSQSRFAYPCLWTLWSQSPVIARISRSKACHFPLRGKVVCTNTKIQKEIGENSLGFYRSPGSCCSAWSPGDRPLGRSWWEGSDCPGPAW